MMRFTMTDYYGDDLFGGLTICAKTGTAEVGEDKALTVGWQVMQRTRIALLHLPALWKTRGFGFTYAGPVVEASYDTGSKITGAAAVQ